MPGHAMTGLWTTLYDTMDDALRDVSQRQHDTGFTYVIEEATTPVKNDEQERTIADLRVSNERLKSQIVEANEQAVFYRRWLAENNATVNNFYEAFNIAQHMYERTSKAVTTGYEADWEAVKRALGRWERFHARLAAKNPPVDAPPANG